VLPSSDSVTALTSVMRPAALGAAAVAGLVAAFGPSTYALMPAVLGFEVAQAQRRRVAIGRALWVIAGMVAVSAAMGAFAGAVGVAAAHWLADRLALSYALAATVMLVLGLRFFGVVRFGVPLFLTPSGGPPEKPWEPFILGLAFGVAACPACTPLMLAVLLGAVAIGKVGFGAMLLASFAVGRSIPILVVAASAATFRKLRAGTAWSKRLDYAGGVMLIGSAAYFTYQAWSVWRGTMTGM